MSPPRDRQRGRVYEAELLVRTMFDRADQRGLRTVTLHGSQVTLPVERKFASVASVQAYLEALAALNWVRERWPRAGTAVTVVERRGDLAAHYDRATSSVAVPLHVGGTAWALRELVILHEYAHHLDPDGEQAPHGPAFVDRHLELVDGVIGPEAAFVLRAAYLDHSVDVAP